MFVNAATAGATLRVEALDEEWNVLPGFSAGDCAGFCGNSTCAEIAWKGSPSLAQYASRPVRFRFQLDKGDLYSFWVTDSPQGESNGYRGAGGPGK